MTKNKAVQDWVKECADLCLPDRIVWCDGSEDERRRLTSEAVRDGVLIPLDQGQLPGCHLHRSNPNDVARVEELTFICSRNQDDAGPTNNWMSPADGYAKLRGIFSGSMRGRTMYVVPYIMGPKGSPFSRVGIELTDSIYVALSMRIMTRMGQVAWDQLGTSDIFVKGLHSLADCNPERRFICHFPEDYTVWSVGSGYGGNVLLSKKCFALRIAGAMARREGWMAEHMLILGLEDPKGNMTYIAAAFPSACGKTNLAMLIPPKSFPGWKVHTVGDDIAWIRVGKDGRLWALNPENGFFGVAPGTSSKTNPSAMATINRNTIFTNVVQTAENTVWWEGMDLPADVKGWRDWLGQPFDPKSGKPGAQANARFTAPAHQCPSIAKNWEAPEGVPLSAILFGARRSKVAPLVLESQSWQHGVYLGATLASETTAAATGKVGVIRRDPMAMLPFCGYHMGDYFQHWLDMGARCTQPPKIYRVNWFRRDADGGFLWPGYGENLRVLKWVVERCQGTAKARETPIGMVPGPDDLDLSGLDFPKERLAQALAVIKEEWVDRTEDQKDFFAKFGDRMPKALHQEREALKQRLGI